MPKRCWNFSGELFRSWAEAENGHGVDNTDSMENENNININQYIKYKNEKISKKIENSV